MLEEAMDKEMLKLSRLLPHEFKNLATGGREVS